jgi:hypothetical protein
MKSLCSKSKNSPAEGSQIVHILRTEPVDAGVLEELGVAATQETFTDECLWTLLLFATEVFIPVSFIFAKSILRLVYFY